MLKPKPKQEDKPKAQEEEKTPKKKRNKHNNALCISQKLGERILKFFTTKK
jgi:hypothetical protein